MKSLAVTLGRRLPRITTFTLSGTFTRTSFVIQELKTSVVPMPKAMQPIAPTCGVCESEPTFSTRETGVPRLHRGHTHLVFAANHVPGKNLFGNRHWSRLGFNRRQEYFALHARHVEWEQAAVLNDLPRNFIFAAGEFSQWDFLP